MMAFKESIASVAKVIKPSLMPASMMSTSLQYWMGRECEPAGIALKPLIWGQGGTLRARTSCTGLPLFQGGRAVPKIMAWINIVVTDHLVSPDAVVEC